VQLLPLADNHFGAAQDVGQSVTVTAVITPPIAAPPDDLVVWQGPLTGAAPLQRTFLKDTVRSVHVVSAVGGTTREMLVDVMEFTVEVAPTVRPLPPAGVVFATADAAPLTATAVLSPLNGQLPAHAVTWNAGTPVAGDQTRQRFARAAATRFDVRATFAGTARTVNVTVVQIEAVGTATNAAPPLTFVRFGLWDGGYDAAGAIHNGVAEADNFAGSDRRRLHFRVRDPSKPADAVQTVSWKTLDSARADDDAPAVQTLTLPSVSPGVFISRGVLLVTNDVDRDVAVDSGLVGIAGEGGVRARGQSNHRLRRARIDGLVRCEYTAAPGVTLSLELPVFKRVPDERRRLAVRVVSYTSAAAGYVAATAAHIAGQFEHANQHWQQIGIQVDPGATAVRPVPAGALNAANRFPFVHPNGAEEIAVLSDLIPLTPDNTLTVVFIDLAGANAYAAILPVNPIPVPAVPPAPAPPPLTMGNRFFVFMGTRLALTDETLAHELHHVLFNRFDTATDRQFFTLNTNAPGTLVAGTGIVLPDARIYGRIQNRNSPDPDNDPANANIVNWARRTRVGRAPVAGGLGAATATTGNTLLSPF
jgi:hypothetical protein